MHGGSFVPHVMPRFSTALVSSNINPNAPTSTRTRPSTRQWATAVSSAGQPTALYYRPLFSPPPLFPAEPHRHRPATSRSHGRPPRARGAPREQREPFHEYQRRPKGDRSADCSSGKDCCWCAFQYRRWGAFTDRHTIRPAHGALDPRKAPGPVQEVARDCAEGS
jgi:hypothetical protein